MIFSQQKRSIHSVETDVDFLMSSSNITAKLKLKPQKELKRKAKGGIHAYKIILHTMKSLKTSETVRNEHLPKERKQKALSSPPMDTIAEDSVEAKSTSRFENEPKKVTGTRLGSGSSSSDGELSNESPNESGSESGSESKRESKRKCESRSKSRSRSRSTEGRLKENQASTSSGKSESATLREQSTTELPTTPKKRSSPNRISKFVNSFRKKSDSSSPSSSQATFQAPMLGAISWTKYESSSKKIGRKNKKKTMQQSEDVELELTAEFELKKEELEMILSCFNVLAHFKKLQDVINLVEDELVPVAVETDVSALYTGRVKLKNFKWRENITDSEDITDTAQFEIPDEYTENPLRIQGLGF